jgi:hypothetical protein
MSVSGGRVVASRRGGGRGRWLGSRARRSFFPAAAGVSRAAVPNCRHLFFLKKRQEPCRHHQRRVTVETAEAHRPGRLLLLTGNGRSEKKSWFIFFDFVFFSFQCLSSDAVDK